MKKEDKYKRITFQLVLLAGLIYAWLVAATMILPHSLETPLSEPKRAFFEFGEMRIGVPNEVDLTVYIQLEPPNWDNSQLVIKVSGISYRYRQNDGGMPADKLCIEQLLIGSMREHQFDETVTRLMDMSHDVVDREGTLCHLINMEDEEDLLVDFTTPLSAEDDDSKVTIYHHPSFFMYPYDGFKTHAALQLTYSLWNEDELLKRETTLPDIFVSSSRTSEQDWDVSVEATRSVWSKLDQESIQSRIMNFDDFRDTHIIRQGAYYFFDIKLSRPILPELSLPFFALILSLLILAMSFVEELGSFLESSVAIVVSIFGIRQILLPAGSSGVRTMIDTVILGLYVIFGVSFVLFVLPLLANGWRSFRSPVRGSDIAKYVAVQGKSVFHKPDCFTISSTPKERQVGFSDDCEAVKVGLRPCKICLHSTDMHTG